MKMLRVQDIVSPLAPLCPGPDDLVDLQIPLLPSDMRLAMASSKAALLTRCSLLSYVSVNMHKTAPAWDPPGSSRSTRLGQGLTSGLEHRSLGANPGHLSALLLVDGPLNTFRGASRCIFEIHSNGFESVPN